MSEHELIDRMNRLMENQDFIKVFIEHYLGSYKDSILWNEDIRNEKIIDKLQSIQELRNFISYYFDLNK